MGVDGESMRVYYRDFKWPELPRIPTVSPPEAFLLLFSFLSFLSFYSLLNPLFFTFLTFTFYITFHILILHTLILHTSPIEYISSS